MRARQERAEARERLRAVVQAGGGRAHPRQLADAAEAYENSVVRRLGLLLEHRVSLRPIGTGV